MNKQTSSPTNTEHQDVSLLLPWYINHTLNELEQKRVEKHLQQCLVCKIDVNSLKKLSIAIRETESLDPVRQASFMQLKQRIQKQVEPVRKKQSLFYRLFNFSHWLNAINENVVKQPLLNLSLAVFIAVSLFLLPGQFDSEQVHDKSFRTLSSSELSQSAANEIQLVFSEKTTQQQISQILTSIHGQIIDGPSPQGVFKVRLGEQQMQVKDILNTVARLQKNAHIIFAEPNAKTLSRISR